MDNREIVGKLLTVKLLTSVADTINYFRLAGYWRAPAGLPLSATSASRRYIVTCGDQAQPLRDARLLIALDAIQTGGWRTQVQGATDSTSLPPSALPAGGPIICPLLWTVAHCVHTVLNSVQLRIVWWVSY